MASPKIEVFFIYDSSGNPLTGVVPTFNVYKDDTGTNLTQPTITEIGGGAYKFTPTFTTGRGIVYIISTGTGNLPAHYAKFIRPEDYAPDQLLTLAQGKWEIKTSGPDANRMILYDNDGTTVIQKFDLTDRNGNPATTNVFLRSPVLPVP